MLLGFMCEADAHALSKKVLRLSLSPALLSLYDQA